MKITYAIVCNIEGSLGELLAPCNWMPAATLDEVLASLAELAFIAETVAHLQGKEAALLPAAEKARALIAKLQPVVA